MRSGPCPVRPLFLFLCSLSDTCPGRGFLFGLYAGNVFCLPEAVRPRACLAGFTCGKLVPDRSCPPAGCLFLLCFPKLGTGSRVRRYVSFPLFVPSVGLHHQHLGRSAAAFWPSCFPFRAVPMLHSAFICFLHCCFSRKQKNCGCGCRLWPPCFWLQSSCQRRCTPPCR